MYSESRQEPSRDARTLLIVLVAVSMLLMIAVIWRYSRRAATAPSLSEGRQMSEAFLAHLQKADIDAAYAATTTEFKNAQGRDKFVKFVKSRKFLRASTTFVSVQSVMLGETPRAEYLFRTSDGAHTIRLLAGNDSGTWQVDRLIAD